MFHAYVLLNVQSDRIYIGQTANLEARLKQHNDPEFDKRSFTKLNKGAWELVYSEAYATRKEAMRREKELKSFKGRGFIRRVIEGL